MDNNNNKISKILDESTRKIKFNIDQKKEIEILEESSIYIPAMCPLESIIGFELFSSFSLSRT